MCTEEVMAILADGSHSKTSRDNELFSLLSKSKEQVLSTWPDVNENIISKVFWEQVVRNCMRDTVLDKNTRSVCWIIKNMSVQMYSCSRLYSVHISPLLCTLKLLLDFNVEMCTHTIE